MSSPSLTLILAATPSLGIGKGGGLPWPQLRKEMGYFARVTKRTFGPAADSNGARRVNAVLMGRKTWDSIPPKFRPLRDRLNIVITRKPEDFKKLLDQNAEIEGPLVASGVLDALSKVHELALSPEAKVQIDRIFVIGGASIYAAALELPQTKHVLLTKIDKEYECDTFFPTNLDNTAVWKNVGRTGLEEFVGEEIVEGGVEEHCLRFEFCLFERGTSNTQ